MPPKRMIKSASSKSKPPTLVPLINEHDSGESAEAELKFDREVLWSISQFEKLLSTGKLPEAKKQESIKAINTLRKSSVPKIQKIQLMRQYFKDIKSKMLKEEEAAKTILFDVDLETDVSRGIFVKRKARTTDESEPKSFRFNFTDPSHDDLMSITSQINSIELS